MKIALSFLLPAPRAIERRSHPQTCQRFRPKEYPMKYLILALLSLVPLASAAPLVFE